MASSTVQKLLRTQTRSASKILTDLHNPLPRLTQILEVSKPIDPISNHPETDYLKPNHSCSSHVYPGFSFGIFLNPNSPSTLIRSEHDGEMIRDDECVIRADSVKKKWKRKMNKHKLKKLRKSLRRKT